MTILYGNTLDYIGIDLNLRGLIGIFLGRQDGSQGGHGVGNFGGGLLVGLERYRFQPESFRIDVQIFVGYEEEIVFFRRSESAESRENDGLFYFQHFSEFSEEVTDDVGGDLLLDFVAACVEVYKRGVLRILLLSEI